MYISKVTEIIVSESHKLSHEHKEIALDSIIQILHIPGLASELFLNFDCDLYCTNLFEDLTKLLSKVGFIIALDFYRCIKIEGFLNIFEQPMTTLFGMQASSVGFIIASCSNGNSCNM